MYTQIGIATFLYFRNTNCEIDWEPSFFPSNSQMRQSTQCLTTVPMLLQLCKIICWHSVAILLHPLWCMHILMIQCALIGWHRVQLNDLYLLGSYHRMDIIWESTLVHAVCFSFFFFVLIVFVLVTLIQLHCHRLSSVFFSLYVLLQSTSVHKGWWLGNSAFCLL